MTGETETNKSETDDTNTLDKNRRSKIYDGDLMHSINEK